MGDAFVLRRSVLAFARDAALDRIGVEIGIRRCHGEMDASYREVLRVHAVHNGQYEDDLGPLPRANEHRHTPESNSVDMERFEAAKAAHLASHPLLVGDVLDCGAVVVHVPEGPRVQDLLENGNSLLEQLRSEKRAHDKTREELAVWKERALTFRSAIRRVDPAWLGEESP